MDIRGQICPKVILFNFISNSNHIVFYSLFAAQAGASIVNAVEASDKMASVASQVIHSKDINTLLLLILPI